MEGVNKVILIGNLGQDPELKYTPNSKAVCNLRLACTEKYKDKETTEWVNVTVWGAPAEACAKFLVKGKQVYVEGRLQTRSYEKDGVKKYATDVVAERVQFLGSGSTEPKQTKFAADRGVDRSDEDAGL